MLSAIRRSEGSIGPLRYCFDRWQEAGDRSVNLGLFVDRTPVLQLGVKLEREDLQLWGWIQIGSKRFIASIGMGD